MAKGKKNRNRGKNKSDNALSNDGINTAKSVREYNAPPSDPGVQLVPKSMKEFMKLRRLAEVSNHAGLRKKNSTKQRKENSKNKEMVMPVQKPVHKSNNNDTTEKKGILNKMKDLQWEIPKKRPVLAAEKRKKKLSKLKLKRKLKEEIIKKNVQEEKSDEPVKDKIEFGEVVHQPPKITVHPKMAAKLGTKNRPGRKDDLLLNSLLKRKVTKRRNLSVSEKRILDKERENVIAAYRKMKDTSIIKLKKSSKKINS